MRYSPTWVGRSILRVKQIQRDGVGMLRGGSVCVSGSLGMGMCSGAGSGCVDVSVVCVSACLQQLRAYVRRKITTGSHLEKRGRGEGAPQNGGRVGVGRKSRLQARNHGGGGQGAQSRRRLLPQLSCYHGNLCSGCPHLNCQDNDTTGWEGVWGVVRTD